MSSHFWEGIQGLTSVPSLLQGLGAAPVFSPACIFFLWFLGWLSAETHSHNAIPSTFEEAAGYSGWKIPTSERSCAWMLARGCWPADPIARFISAAKNFPCWTKEMQKSISKQQQAGKKKKCMGWDESSQCTAGECKVIFCLLCGPAASDWDASWEGGGKKDQMIKDNKPETCQGELSALTRGECTGKNWVKPLSLLPTTESRNSL